MTRKQAQTISNKLYEITNDIDLPEMGQPNRLAIHNLRRALLYVAHAYAIEAARPPWWHVWRWFR